MNGRHFKEYYRNDIFFRFDKKLIENLNWARLPKASKAVYPVIGCFANQKGVSYPSEATIASRCGRTEKIVRNGIQGLYDLPGVIVRPYTTTTGRRSKKFVITQPAIDSRSWFPFHKAILEGGHWSRLNPTAQSVYPVMRFFGFFNLDRYVEQEGIEEGDFDTVFPNRFWDFCHAEKDLIAKHAGVGIRSIYRAMNSLVDCFLLEKHDTGVWRVMIHPRMRFKASYLNSRYLKVVK